MQFQARSFDLPLPSILQGTSDNSSTYAKYAAKYGVMDEKIAPHYRCPVLPARSRALPHDPYAPLPQLSDPLSYTHTVSLSLTVAVSLPFSRPLALSLHVAHCRWIDCSVPDTYMVYLLASTRVALAPHQPRPLHLHRRLHPRAPLTPSLPRCPPPPLATTAGLTALGRLHWSPRCRRPPTHTPSHTHTRHSLCRPPRASLSLCAALSGTCRPRHVALSTVPSPPPLARRLRAAPPLRTAPPLSAAPSPRRPP